MKSEDDFSWAEKACEMIIYIQKGRRLNLNSKET